MCIHNFWSKQSCMFLWDEEIVGQTQGYFLICLNQVLLVSSFHIDWIQSLDDAQVSLTSDVGSWDVTKCYCCFHWLICWIWSELTVNIRDRFKGSVCYASNNALLALWFLQHFLFHDDFDNEYISFEDV